MGSIGCRLFRRAAISTVGALVAVGAAAAGEVPTTTATPTATVEPTRSVRPIQISCDIVVEPVDPGVGDTVQVQVRRHSNGLGYPGLDAYRLSAFPLFTEVDTPHKYGQFTLIAVAEGRMTLVGTVMDEFIIGYFGQSPTFGFSNARCEIGVTVGPPKTATATQPSHTPTLTPSGTATVATATPTFTPTSCVSDLPTIEEVPRGGGLRRTLRGFNRGLFCFRGGTLSVEGSVTDDLIVNCGTGTYEASIVLTRADAVNQVRVCHHPGVCGSVACETIALAHTSARTFVVDTPADGEDASPGDDACATSIGSCSLRAAVQEANAHRNNDTTAIRLPSRTHALALNTGDDDSAATGDLDVRSEISIEGTSGSVIDGSTDALPPPLQAVFEVHDEGILRLANVTIRGGHGWQGGAVGNRGALSLERVTLRQNVAAGVGGTGGFGGGLWNEGAAYLVDVAIEDNVADATPFVGVSSGGGLWNNGFMRVSRATISGNSAMVGGGIYNGAVLELTNVTLTGNSACCLDVDSRGGGIMSDGSVTLRNATVTNNSADGAGSGLFGSGHVTLSLLVENPPGSDTTGNCGGSITSGGSNIDSDGSCAFTGAGDQISNPLLTLLQPNGGYTRTYGLRAGSPAIDVAAASQCAAVDQRGVTRPHDGDGDTTARCDLGAFESRGAGDGACSGDCNSSGGVTIDELVRGVNIALDVSPVAGCFAVDTNADDRVAVYEIVAAVERLLDGCPK